jgi:hypothetical protein
MLEADPRMRTFKTPIRTAFTMAVMAVLGSTPLLTPAGPALAAVASVPLPFAEGEAVRIIQGYNGGTHQGASVYGLDLVLTSRETSGAPVLAPFDGTVPWAFAPGEKTGCIEILAQDGTFGAMLCHVILDRPFGRGERVSRGQQLGTVGAAGTVGNNGAPHVHMELHVGGRSSNMVPFSVSGGGLPLEGWDLPANGGSNDHGGEGPLTSSNALSSGPVAAAPQAPSKQQPVMAIKGCAPGVTPTFRQGFAAIKTQLGDAVGNPTSCEFADPNGTGDVLQQTSNGLAFWRKSSNTPTFTNGNQHWALTAKGWVQWTGASIDPPTAGGPGAA